MFHSRDLLKLVEVAEEGEGSPSAAAPRTLGGELGGEALEGLRPPLAVGSAAAALRRRGRSTGALEQNVPEREIGAVEARHRRQVDALNDSLKQAEADRSRLQREVNELRREAAEKTAKAEAAAAFAAKKAPP